MLKEYVLKHYQNLVHSASITVDIGRPVVKDQFRHITTDKKGKSSEYYATSYRYRFYA